MNNDRRAALTAIREKASGLRIQAEELKGDLEALRDEEHEYLDNMPESFRDGEKGEKAEAAVSALDDAISSLEDCDTSFDEVDSHIETAVE